MYVCVCIYTHVYMTHLYVTQSLSPFEKESLDFIFYKGTVVLVWVSQKESLKQSFSTTFYLEGDSGKF